MSLNKTFLSFLLSGPSRAQYNPVVWASHWFVVQRCSLLVSHLVTMLTSPLTQCVEGVSNDVNGVASVWFRGFHCMCRGLLAGRTGCSRAAGRCLAASSRTRSTSSSTPPPPCSPAFSSSRTSYSFSCRYVLVVIKGLRSLFTSTYTHWYLLNVSGHCLASTYTHWYLLKVSGHCLHQRIRTDIY